MVHFCRLASLFLLLFIHQTVFALVPLGTEYKTEDWSQGIWHPSYSAACTSALAYVNRNAVTSKLVECTDQRMVIDRVTGGSSLSITKMWNRVGACPANSKPSGSQCACDAGYEEKGTQCVKPDKCSGLAALCSGMSGSQKSYSTYDGDAETACYQPPDDLFWDHPKFPGCNQGCMSKAGPSTGVTDSTGKTLYKGMGTLTGSKCTYGTPTEPSAPDDPPPAEKTEPVDKRCAGQTGTVNGDTVCIPAASATGVDWTGSTTNSDGTKTEGKTTTTCSNGICESTTVTTNKDANGSTTGTTTKTDTVSQSDYCAKTKNKDGMLCAAVNADPVPGKDNQSGGKPGTGSGNGDGDGCTITDCGNDTGGGPGKAGLPGTGAGEFGKLYEPKYPQGPVEVWKQSSAGIKNSGLGSLAMALMPKIGDGGSAPVWIVDFNFWPLGDMGMHDISPPIWLWAALMSITILTALATARRLIFGG